MDRISDYSAGNPALSWKPPYCVVSPLTQQSCPLQQPLLGMLPKGLVLLISVSLAMGVIRLSRMKILVQNMYALEALARVDVLCLDKTGTITDGEMKVCEKIDAYGMPPQFVQEMLEEYLGGSEDNNAT